RMRKRFVIAAAMAAVASIVPLAGQSRTAIPRIADGHPDLQGTYDLATLTPVERAAGSPLVLSDEDVKKGDQAAYARGVAGDATPKGDRPAPPLGGDGSPGPAGNVGGYNSFWIDAGSQYTSVDGRKRASLVIDPPDGRVPQMTPQARQRFARKLSPSSAQTPRENDPGFEPDRAAPHPSRQPLVNSCRTRV